MEKGLIVRPHAGGKLNSSPENMEHLVMSNEEKHHKDWIHYKVDDEPESTLEKVLTPYKIMHNAGIDPKTNFLEQIKDHHVISYKEDPNKDIEMENGMRFIAKPTGPMPVS